ncbi:DUF1153 domain-containing protein [Herbaspirillum huttiense]|uniref:DUF1153 domain-containing protein n=1 Tax=Herbaspirillum huttiense TaxID=863372 RepID=UPI0039AEDDF8
MVTSQVKEEEFKHWTAKRKAALAIETIHEMTTVGAASRSFDIPPSEIEEWVDEDRKGVENSLRSKALDVREQYEQQLKELQEACGEAMLELRAIKELASLLGEEDK